MSWPALLLWALILPTALLEGPALIYMLCLVGVFMSLQMLPGDGGGANLLPATVYAAVLVGKVALAPGNLLRALEAALDIRRLGLFTAFIAYAVLSAIFLPRMFAGLAEVIPVSGGDLNGPSLLAPRSGNVTQTGYMAISYLTALAFAVIGSRADVRRHYRLAMVCCGLAVIGTGLLDLVTYHLGLGGLLDPFRTASYALLTDVEAAGAKRVVGLTPEASAFGALSVSTGAVLLLLRPLYRPGWERTLATLVLIGVLGMAALSTSATAYVGASVLFAVYLIDLARRLVNPHAIGRTSTGWEVALLAAAGVGAILFPVVLPDRAAPLFDVLDKIIFQKSASFSYYQRMLWTQIGWRALLDTGGLGVGLGSIRTSNWFVSILGSTGLFGGALVFGFVIQKLTASTRGLSPEAAAFATGVKLTLIPFLVMSALGGTIPDIGATVAIALGFLSIAPSSREAATQFAERAPTAARPRPGALAKGAAFAARGGFMPQASSRTPTP